MQNIFSYLYIYIFVGEPLICDDVYDAHIFFFQCMVCEDKRDIVRPKILSDFDACKSPYITNFIIIQKSQIAFPPIFEPVTNKSLIHKERGKILFEIFVAYFIDLNRELIKKRARIFDIDIFRANVIEVRHYFLIHIPEEVINISPLFLVDRDTYATSPPKKDSGNLARHERGHV